jgi:hypothetical protein
VARATVLIRINPTHTAAAATEYKKDYIASADMPTRYIYIYIIPYNISFLKKQQQQQLAFMNR